MTKLGEDEVRRAVGSPLDGRVMHANGGRDERKVV